MVSRGSTMVLGHWVSQSSDNSYSITQMAKGGRCVYEQRHVGMTPSSTIDAIGGLPRLYKLCTADGVSPIMGYPPTVGFRLASMLFRYPPWLHVSFPPRTITLTPHFARVIEVKQVISTPINSRLIGLSIGHNI